MAETKKSRPKIAAVVVTFNRRQLLAKTLDALLNGTRSPDRIFIYDNASTDETPEYLEEKGFLAEKKITYIRAKENLGSATGNAKAIKAAYQAGFDWVWVFDDDLLPDHRALEFLVKDSKIDDTHCFASVDLNEKDTTELAWYNDVIVNGEIVRAKKYTDLGKENVVESHLGIGYLGLFLPRRIIRKVGYPDERLFIWADDVDYMNRIKRAGFRQFFVRRSLTYHPKAPYTLFKFLWKDVYITMAAPWKEYYAIRNSIYIWGKYDGRTRTLLVKVPKQIILWTYVLIKYQDKKLLRAVIYTRAFFDGITGRLGAPLKP